MEEDNVKKRSGQKASEEPPQQITSQTYGSLRVHVVDNVGNVVRQARVTATAKRGEFVLPGKTDASGDCIIPNVPTGPWSVKAEAFGLFSEPLPDVPVNPKCETEVERKLPFGLQIEKSLAAGDRGGSNLPFYPGNSIIVATASLGGKQIKGVLFDWVISHGRKLGPETRGDVIYIDPAGFSGTIDIEVKMSEDKTKPVTRGVI